MGGLYTIQEEFGSTTKTLLPNPPTKTDCRFITVSTPMKRKNPELREKIATFAESRGWVFRKNIGYTVLPDTIYTRLHQAHPVYICTSHREGGPLPPMDSMSQGGVVISTPVGQMLELIEDGVTGFLCSTEQEFQERMVDIMSIGLITRFKNRLSTLKFSLLSWSSIKEFDSITIVDWSSTEDIIPLVDSVGDNRVQVLRIEGRQWFEPGFCFNVGIRNINTTFICAVDCDIILHEKFQNLFKSLESTSFLTFNKAEVGTFGTCIFPKTMWEHLNGYIEGQIGWGGEDSNFYSRAEHAGYLRKPLITHDMIEHQPHTDTDRLKYYPFKIKQHRRESRLYNEKWMDSVNVKNQPRNKIQGKVYNRGKWSELLWL